MILNLILFHTSLLRLFFLYIADLLHNTMILYQPSLYLSKSGLLMQPYMVVE
nr:MAG TPA: hypothetical protein [Bacteriophage sp.]